MAVPIKATIEMDISYFSSVESARTYFEEIVEHLKDRHPGLQKVTLLQIEANKSN